MKAITTIPTAPGRIPGWVVLIPLFLLLAAGCGSSASGDAGAVGLEVSDVWTRPTAPGAESTAFYLTVRNDGEGDDRLVGADSPMCGATEIHLSSMQDGVMSMNLASSEDLGLPPGEQLVLEPGGLHIMCMGLAEPVVVGEPVSVSLRFEQGEPVLVDAEVK